MASLIISFILCGIYLFPVPVSAVEIFPNKSIKMLYVNSCAECHGRRAKGGGDAPRLRSNDIIRKSDIRIIDEMISKGIPKNKSSYPGKYEGGMPPFKKMSKEEIRELAKLIKDWNQ